MALSNVTKNSILDVAGVVDLPLSLLDEVFQTYLSQKSVLCKIISCKDIISNKQFRVPTIYRQVLIFIDKFCCYK